MLNNINMLDTCKYFRLCGGCDFQDKTYPEQLKYKANYVGNLLKQFKPQKMCEIVGSPQSTYYRNKMEFVFSGEKNNIQIGQRQKDNFRRVVDLEDCLIFSENLKSILDLFRQWGNDNNLEAYHLVKHTGLLRYLMFRESKHQNDMLLVLVVALDKEEYLGAKFIFDDLISRLIEIPEIKSVYLFFDKEVADVIKPENKLLIFGKEFIEERINEIKYIINPSVFFQTNSKCCAKLYQIIIESLSDISGSILDLFCGSGGITLQIAEFFKNVYGVDNSAYNIAMAIENAKLNKINNAHFLCEDAKDFLNKVSSKTFEVDFDAIVVDPPRSGLSKDMRKDIINSKIKNLVYISCNPLSMYADFKELSSVYAIKEARVVDMFPHTRHMETVIKCTRE